MASKPKIIQGKSKANKSGKLKLPKKNTIANFQKAAGIDNPFQIKTS